MKNNDFYIDFEVAPWALANVCETLYKHGVTDGAITQEDGRLHIRWKYDINRDNDFWWKFDQQKPIDYPEPADSPCNPPKGSALDISGITVPPNSEVVFNKEHWDEFIAYKKSKGCTYSDVTNPKFKV